MPRRGKIRPDAWRGGTDRHCGDHRYRERRRRRLADTVAAQGQELHGEAADADRDPEGLQGRRQRRGAHRSEPARAAGFEPRLGRRQAPVRTRRVLSRQREGPAGDQPAASPAARSIAARRRSAYSRYIARREASFKSALAARVPAAKVGRALRLVYGGIALRVPANKVADVLRLPGVTAVQRDTLQHPRTDAVSSFIGATTVTNEIGGVRRHRRRGHDLRRHRHGHLARAPVVRRPRQPRAGARRRPPRGPASSATTR